MGGTAGDRAGLLAIYTLASLGRRRWQRLGLLVVILVTFPPASLLVKHNSLDEFMFTLLLPLAAFLLGSLERSRREHAETLRERAEQLDRERIAETARAAADERARVARDMHDILAHAVSLMVVQAEAGPVVVRSDPDRAERAFEAIADAGRDAMTQLRRLLGVLQEWTDPARSLPEDAVSLDHLLTDVSIYWFTNTSATTAAATSRPSKSPTNWSRTSARTSAVSVEGVRQQ